MLVRLTLFALSMALLAGLLALFGKDGVRNILLIAGGIYVSWSVNSILGLKAEIRILRDQVGAREPTEQEILERV